MLNFFQFIVFMSLFTISLFAQQRIPIAVMDLDGLGISKIESKIISVRLRTHLINTGKFVVLEREKMEEILSEQGFQLSGCTSNECVVQAGQLLGVKQIVAGSVGKIGNIFTITVKTIDVQSGEIIKSATEDCECNIETVLTTAVKNVVQILSGNEIKSSSYIQGNPSIKKENKFSNNINEWEILGLSRDEYIGYKKSGLSIKGWKLNKKKYLSEKSNEFITSLKSMVMPGWGQHSIGEKNKAKTSFVIEGLLITEILISFYISQSYFNEYNDRNSNGGNAEDALDDFRSTLLYIRAGVLLSSIHRLYSIYSAYTLTSKKNKELKNKYRISFYPKYDYQYNTAKICLSLKL